MTLSSSSSSCRRFTRSSVPWESAPAPARSLSRSRCWRRSLARFPRRSSSPWSSRSTVASLRMVAISNTPFERLALPQAAALPAPAPSPPTVDGQQPLALRKPRRGSEL
eukprot:4489446-Prymnesium_polylepis.1